jgi:8-oxo-dGTP diphosphatase
MAFTYEYARPALTADCVVFGLDDNDLKVLLIQRDLEPFAGRWALPGGFAVVGESIEETARRELAEETGLTGIFLEQLYTFSDPARDPREHVVTVAHYALINLSEHVVTPSTDARNAAWFEISDIPQLAFDHDLILQTAHERLQGKIRYQPKKILKMGILEELDEIETDVAHRAARLYKFNKEKYDHMAKQGFNFEI